MRTVVLLALALVVVLVFAVALWKIPEMQVPEGAPADRQAELEHDSRVMVAIVEFGVIVTSTLIALWARLRNVEQLLRASGHDRLGERFDRAIAQLAEDNEAVVIGAIYSLERVARESTAEYWKVMEILTSYVRSSSGAEDNSDYQGSTNQSTNQTSSKSSVQAVLDVLGRRDRGQETADQRIDLRNSDLRGVNLQGAHLERAILFGSRLQWADLRGAHLENAILWGVNLEGANIEGTHLEGTNFWEAKLYDARMSGAHLQGASLLNVNGLTMEQIQLAYVDDSTVLPEGAAPANTHGSPQNGATEETPNPTSRSPLA